MTTSIKTLVCFTYFGDNNDPFFFELDGDYSHLNGVVINASDDEPGMEELGSIVDKLDNEEITKLTKPTKDWDHFIQCGWVL